MQGYQEYQEGKHPAPASSSVGCSQEWGGPPPGLCSLAKFKETFPLEEFRLLRLWQKERDAVPALFFHDLGTDCIPESVYVMILLLPITL